jgi:hypothetical protein
MDDSDKRTERPSVTLSPAELRQVNQARGDMPRAQWIREAVLEKLERDGYGIEDTARRPARRRRNYSERQQQGKGQQS